MSNAKKNKGSKDAYLKPIEEFKIMELKFSDTVKLLNKDTGTPLIHLKNKKCAHVIDSLTLLYLNLVEKMVSEERECTPYGLKDLDESLPNVEPIKIWKNLRDYYYHTCKAKLDKEINEYKEVKSKVGMSRVQK